jgi:uncharacterized protein (TIGR02466 family)
MQILKLFPTAIGKLTLDPGLTDAEKGVLLSFETRNNLSNKTSVNTDVLNHPDLKRLKNFIIESTSNYLTQVINPISECNLYITQSWINQTNVGESHHQHRHPNSIVSGVFYIKTDPERDKIYFYRREKSDIKIHSKEYTDINSDHWWLPANENVLLLFPSYLEHSVTNVSEGTIVRSSLSFNTFAKGIIGLETNLDKLILE